MLRSSDGINFAPLSLTSSTTVTDATAAAGTSYLYSVRVSAPYISETSLPDLATTVMFSDDPLVAGVTPIRAVHVTDLRTAVTAVRALAALAASSFTDPTITAGVTLVKAAHMAEHPSRPHRSPPPPRIHRGARKGTRGRLTLPQP